MAWQYGMMIALILICIFVQYFYNVLYDVCVDMLDGNLLDEDNKRVKLSAERKDVIEVLKINAKRMKWFAIIALAINGILLLSINSDISTAWKILAALFNARILISLFQIIKDTTTIGSYVSKS